MHHPHIRNHQTTLRPTLLLRTTIDQFPWMWDALGVIETPTIEETTPDHTKEMRPPQTLPPGGTATTATNRDTSLETALRSEKVEQPLQAATPPQNKQRKEL